MKRLKLVDAAGLEFDLNDTSSQFMYDVTGLGLAYTNTFSNVADGFFPASYKRISQASVAGSIAFASNDKYREFVSFISNAQNLRIGYAPSGTWFFSRCAITKMTKADKASISCDVEFRLLSPWAKNNPIRKSITAEDDSLNYPLVYPYRYGKASAEAAAEFRIGGNMDGSYEIKISGSVKNPNIKLFKYDNGWQLIGKCSVSYEMVASDVFVLSTVPGTEKVEINGTDISSILNITDNVFARPVSGKNKIVIESDSAITASAELDIYDYYLSV